MPGTSATPHYIQEKDGRYDYELSPEGRKCHYLQFLINTSNFTWRKRPEEIEESEIFENNLHLLSKMCAIGYMLMECKDANVTRAVIGMDGKQSEVGDSNGRSGKSLVGELMRQVVDTVYISGKRTDIFNDSFIWNDIDERTRLVFIDDVMLNFNFEFLFPNLTGDWTVNKRGRTYHLSVRQITQSIYPHQSCHPRYRFQLYRQAMADSLLRFL